MTVLRIVYFASVREYIGIDAEDRAIPDVVASIADLLDWLSAQDSVYRTAFQDRRRLRFALDHKMADAAAPLSGATEIAIFPPVTGG